MKMENDLNIINMHTVKRLIFVRLKFPKFYPMTFHTSLDIAYLNLPLHVSDDASAENPHNTAVVREVMGKFAETMMRKTTYMSASSTVREKGPSPSGGSFNARKKTGKPASNMV
jgi:hypothetical protein